MSLPTFQATPRGNFRITLVQLGGFQVQSRPIAA